MKNTLYNKLIEYSKSDIYPFCMPGHKRQNSIGSDPYKIDITEVEGFDDLHHAEGILKNITDEAAIIYNNLGSDFCNNDQGSSEKVKRGASVLPEVFMSVNGSSACNLAAVNAIPGCDNILIAANCHRSVFNGAKISGKKVIELAPAWISELEVYGGISHADVENALKGYPDIKAVIITSPSYEGFVSDVKKIAEVVHRHGAYLIVDEAHGAHLPFCKDLPVSALYLGADIVIHSLHKTVGSLNQTALAFVNAKELAENFREKLLMFMTTSPSYVLMASIEQSILWADKNKNRFEEYQKELKKLRKDIKTTAEEKKSAISSIKNDEKSGTDRLDKNMHGVCIVDRSVVGRYNVFDLDESKIVFYKHGMSGEELYRLFLNEHRLQFEKYDKRIALAMTTVWDTEEGFARLINAVKDINEK